MAERNSIDLTSGSQDLSTSFFHHYAEHAAPWFIMDAESRYIAHSRDIGRIFRTKLDKLNGKTDEDLVILSESYRRKSKKIRLLALKNKVRVITLEINFFFSDQYYTPLVFITEPFKCNYNYFSITRIIDINSLRCFNFLIYNNLANKKELTDSVLEKPVIEFSNINPTHILSELQ